MHRLLLAPALLLTAPVAAQQVEEPPPIEGSTIFDGDFVTLGLGAAYVPSYDGSDDYVFSPLPVVQGSLGGIDFSPRGPGLAVDLIPDEPGARVDLILGPVGRLRLDRVRQIEDPVVERLGELDTAVELGAAAGVQVNRLLNPFDSLTVQADLRYDVAGAHSGRVVQPTVTYFTPVSRGAAVSLSLSAENVDDDYARYYYSVGPLGAAASGLPLFAADGGWKSLGATVLAGFDLDGDLTNGGVGLFAIGGYSSMLEDAKRSPLTSIRGDADQWFGGLGVGYTF